MNTGRVETEGDEIFYEVRGQGQPLLMISGGGGDAGFFSFVADILADEYKVITYDRRGNSRSTGRDPRNFEISQQSRDAVAVLRAVGETAAFIFGNSGGAVIALDMAKTQPQAIKAAVVHEPPVVRVLPDSEKWHRFFASLYRMAFSRMAFGFGVRLAMFRLSLSLGIPRRAYAKVPKDLGTRLGKNHDFLVKHEMLPFTNYKPDVEVLKKNGVKVFMAAGKRTLEAGKYYGRTAPILADLLGCEMVTFPGHHLSYLDMPEAWAAALRAVLQREESRGHPRFPG
jgi:pimeloyl-ACP methyl ester carboxylesterase